MGYRSRIRSAVTTTVLAGFAVAGLGFTHVVQPGPEYTGGLHHPAAVVKIDHRMKPFPDWTGGRAGAAVAGPAAARLVSGPALQPDNRSDWDIVPANTWDMQ